MNVEPQFSPCAHVEQAIQRLAANERVNPLFVLYVRKHIAICSQCQEALESLHCYHQAVRQAYHDTEGIAESGLSRDELDALIGQLANTG